MVDTLSQISEVGFSTRHANCIARDAGVRLCAFGISSHPYSSKASSFSEGSARRVGRAERLSLKFYRSQIRNAAAARNGSVLAQFGSLPKWQMMAQGTSSRFVGASVDCELSQGVATPP